MNAITTAVVACAAFSSIAHGAEAVRPVPATYIMVCCHGADKGTKFLANGEWDDRHDYRDYAFALDQMRKIKEAGINVVGVDFTNPSQWDQFKAHHWPMLLNVVKAAKELDMQYFLFLGNTCAHTMKYWNEKAKVVWEEFAQDPHYRRYGFGDDRPMMTIFLPGKDFAAHLKRSRPEEKNWLEKFRIGTCQVNDPIVPTPTDGWGYRNKSAGSTDLARFVAPNSGVGPGTWARVDANEWRARVKWALGAKEYAVIGTYDDTCDCIFWGIADVRGSRNPTHVHKATKDDPYVYYNIVKEEVAKDDAARFKAAWESRRGEPYVEVPVSPPIFHGHPRFAQKYSRAIIHFALRAFHNAETNEYALANRKIAENCRFYIENKDVRNDRDSFYWNVGELCRIVLHYGSKGDVAPGLLSPEAEAAFLEMAFGYCHDMSRLSDAAANGMKTWRVYESENHHVQRDSALWQLMHALLKVDPAYGARKLAHGGTLREHYDAWEAFFCAWMRERAKRSMFIEVQSRVYGIHTIKNVYPLYDFSERPETRRIAKSFIDLFWALWAQEQIDGASGGGMSRVYPSAAVKTASEASAWAYWYFGLNPSLSHKPDGMDYVCLDSAYRPHPLIGRIAADAKARGVYEIEMRPLGWTLPSDKYPNYRPDPEWGRIYRYTYATPDFIAGTQMFPQAPGDKWCKISSQNRFHGVVFGPRDAEILPIPAVTGRHAKTVKLPSVGYNAFWSMQRKGTLLTRKNRYASQTGGMRVFFSASGGVDKVERDGEWWFTKCGGAYSAVRVACGEARLVGAGAGAEIPFDANGKFLVCADPWAPVIVETARACDFKDEGAFRAKVKATALSATPSARDYTGIYGNRFHMLLDRDDGSTIDGEPYVRKIDWSVKSPFVRMSWCGDVAELTFGGSTVRLDFSDKVSTSK